MPVLLESSCLTADDNNELKKKCPGRMATPTTAAAVSHVHSASVLALNIN